jgi:hypothetical protein
MSSLLNRLLIALAIAITLIALSIKVVPSGTVGVVSSFGVVQSPPRQPEFVAVTEEIKPKKNFRWAN